MTRSSHARVASALVLGALLVPLTVTRPALADTCSSDPHACAVTFFEAGRKLLEAGDWGGAAPIFQKSLEAQPTIGAYLNLGDCYGKLAQPWDAFTQYAAAERLATETRDPRRAAAEASAAALVGKVLRVRVHGQASGAVIRIDDVKVPDVLVPLLEAGRFGVDPSKGHRAEITPPGGKTWFGSIEGLTGTEHVLDLEPAAAPPVAPPPVAPVVATPPAPGASTAASPAPAPAPPPPGGSPAPGGAMRTTAFVVGGVGIGGLIAGTVAGVLAAGKKNDLNGLCHPYPSMCEASERSAVVSDNNAAMTMQWVSTIGLIAGAAAVATGVVLYFAAPRAEISVSPTVGGAGVILRKVW